MPQIAAEDWLAHPIPLPGAIYMPISTRSTPHTTVSSTTQAWTRLAHLLQAPMLYSSRLPLVYHTNIPLLQEVWFRQLCHKIKVRTWGDLFLNGKFHTSEQLFCEYRPTSLDVFLYIRLRQGIRSILPHFPQEPPNFSPLHLILDPANNRHLVSRLYERARAMQLANSWPARAQWAIDTQTDITDEQWEYCCLQNSQISASSRL